LAGLFTYGGCPYGKDSGEEKTGSGQEIRSGESGGKKARRETCEEGGARSQTKSRKTNKDGNQGKQQTIARKSGEANPNCKEKFSPYDQDDD
jgi:hypothetical protein